MDSIKSLEIINKLFPKTYTHKDYRKYNNKDCYGFIAQEIEHIVPSCVSTMTNYIPNIYDIGILTDYNIITLRTKTINDLSLHTHELVKLQLYVNGKDHDATITEFINDNTFKIDKYITEPITDNSYNGVFVYGQEVSDFYVIDKNTIFTFTTSAVKQIYKELQETQTNVKTLTAELTKTNQLLLQQQEQIKYLIEQQKTK
jgi:hypothetical protein